MSRGNDREKGETRMELKYCEHCGGLWVREGGGSVYCDKCQSQIADLPIPKKRVSHANLPVRRKTAVEDFKAGIVKKTHGEIEAVGGAA